MKITHQFVQEGKNGVFGRISHFRAWIESHMNHSSNYYCDGGLDARDIQPKCECGGLDGVEVSTRVAQIKNVIVLMTYFLLSDHQKNVQTCTFHSNKTLPWACVTYRCQERAFLKGFRRQQITVSSIIVDEFHHE